MIEKILRHRRFIRSIFSRVKISFKVAVPLTILLGSVVAWGFMVDVSEKINRFIVGQNEIAIEEEFLSPQSLTAGSEITKKAWVKNTGTTKCFVRAMCVPSNNDIYNFAQININEGGWTETDSNGWRYFKNPISPGESTSLICENVTIKENADTALIKPFDIYVIAESIQCANYVDAATAFASIGAKNIESDDGAAEESTQENEMQDISEVSENV